MIHFHRWGRWSQPRDVRVSSFACEIDGQPTISYKHKLVQTRTCDSCGLMQTRKVPR